MDVIIDRFNCPWVAVPDDLMSSVNALVGLTICVFVFAAMVYGNIMA